MRRNTILALTTVLAAGAMLTTSPVSPSPAAAATATATLDWQPCVAAELDAFDCATLEVPRDWADPSRGEFDLAVVRARSTGRASERIGSLLFNPGGPGVEGVALAPQVLRVIPARVRRHFDIVIWDPRGVGLSSGLTECTGGSFTPAVTGPVDWTAVAEQMRASQTAANEACEARYPDVVPYISTRATAHDLDALREAVGDEKLTYWGTSYGTRIGYVYAHDFPDRVRVMLLTSPLDPNSTWESFALGATVAADSALSYVFEAMPGAQRRYLRSASTLDERTLTLPSGTVLTRWSYSGMISSFSVWELNAATLKRFIRNVDVALHKTGDVQAAAAAAIDEMVAPLPEIPINGGATPFIGCSDYSDRLTFDEQKSLAAIIRAQAPMTFVFSLQALHYCDGMTIEPDPVPVNFTNWTTPMLIVGSTRDALTPYAWAVDMARTFRSSRLVTYVSSSHTPYRAGSRCVDRYATHYLLTAELPAVDVTCPSTLLDSVRRRAT